MSYLTRVTRTFGFRRGSINKVLFGIAARGELLFSQPAGAPNVAYAYVDGSGNTSRPIGITYPSGRELSYVYDTGADDQLSRVTAYEESE